jgi:hypothetical protein
MGIRANFENCRGLGLDNTAPFRVKLPLTVTVSPVFSAGGGKIRFGRGNLYERHGFDRYREAV